MKMKQTIITILFTLVTTTPILAQNLIKSATVPVSFSKRDFADTIKIKVIDGAVVVPVEIEGESGTFCLIQVHRLDYGKERKKPG